MGTLAADLIGTFVSMAKQTEAQKKAQTTKDFVAVADVRDDVLILKDGSLRSLIEVGSMNFELKSIEEQTAIIQSFQGFINSVDFPLQMLVSSRKLDIHPYLKSLDAVAEALKNELLKIQAVEYSRFIKGLTELANIMSKKFYISVPFYLIEGTTATKAGVFSAFKSIFGSSKFAKTITNEELENYKIQLTQRIELVTTGLSGLGIETRILKREELLSLFYSYYNPGQILSGQIPS